MATKRRPKGEGGASQRSNGTWQAYAFLGYKPNGKPNRKYVSGKTKAEALAKKREIEAQFAKQTSPPSTPVDDSGYTLADWADHWLRKYCFGSVETSTYEWYQSLVRTHVKSSSLAHVKISQVTTDDIQDLLANKLAIEGKSPSTIHAIRSVLHNIMEQAVISGHINLNPVKGAKAPKNKPIKEYIILDAEEKQRLVEVATSEDYPFGALYVLALLTGMRQGETFGLKRDCVDVDRGLVRVWRTVEHTKSGPVLREYPKSHHSRREIVLDDLTTSALGAYIRRHKIHSRDMLFTNTKGGLLGKDGFRNRRWAKLKEDALLPRRMDFHDLRHTHATDLLKAGVHPKIVCERLGHHNVAYTMAKYQHYMPSMQGGIRGELNNLLRR